MTKGYYSLIQYCPDFSRAEAANVGLVLFQVDPARTAVRVLADVKYAARWLGRQGTEVDLVRDVQAIEYRLQHERFGSTADFERFVRTRGNQILLTSPRPMHIEALQRDLDRMFAELVEPVRQVAAATPAARVEMPLLRRTFQDLARRMPDRAWIDHEFHVQSLGIQIRSDYAYRNGKLNLVQEMPELRDQKELRRSALGLSKEGELVKHLEEGEGRLFVVSTATTRKALEHEQLFGDILARFEGATFVPSAEAEQFVEMVKAELVDHD